MSNNLSFDDGSQRITINNDPGRVILWFPNDINFVDRFLAFQQYVENLPERIAAIKGLDGVELDSDGNPTGGLEDYMPGSFEALGAEFNAELDKAFASPVSKSAFGAVNPVSPTPGGGLVYENFLSALTPHIEGSFQGFKASREKYTASSRNRAMRRAKQ